MTEELSQKKLIQICACFDIAEVAKNYVGESSFNQAVGLRFSTFWGDSLSIEDPCSKAIFLLPIKRIQEDKREISGSLLLTTA